VQILDNGMNQQEREQLLKVQVEREQLLKVQVEREQLLKVQVKRELGREVERECKVQVVPERIEKL